MKNLHSLMERIYDSNLNFLVIQKNMAERYLTLNWHSKDIKPDKNKKKGNKLNRFKKIMQKHYSDKKLSNLYNSLINKQNIKFHLSFLKHIIAVYI